MNPWSRAEAEGESFERDLFARRARGLARKMPAGVPSLATVLREVDGVREAREARGRVLIGALLAAACFAAAITGLPRGPLGVDRPTILPDAPHARAASTATSVAESAESALAVPLDNGPTCAGSEEPTCHAAEPLTSRMIPAPETLAASRLSYTPFVAAASVEPECVATAATFAPAPVLATMSHAACESETSCSIASP